MIPQTLLLTNKARHIKLEHRLDFVLHRKGNLTRATRERDEVHEETKRIFNEGNHHGLATTRYAARQDSYLETGKAGFRILL